MTGTAFVDWLGKIKTQKVWARAQAALRRSLAFDPGTYYPAAPYVEPFVKDDGWNREAHYLVAGLYALKKGDHVDDRTLPVALWEARRRRHSPSVERRFLSLLDADRDQISYRLRGAVSLVEGGLDFASLLEDLLAWFRPDRRVQARWAREFYGAGAAQDDGPAQEVLE